METLDGVLLIDKPRGMTSHDVVAKLRYHLNMKRVGHAGTLDPDATGLLTVCLGKATKVSSYLMDGEKTYHVSFCLGKATDTYDSTGEVRSESCSPVSRELVEVHLPSFLGEQLQTPPPYSAVKVGGKKLYEYARNDQAIDAPARPIVVKDFSLLQYDYPTGAAIIVCSKGTYVRSLIHDLGQRLGVGAITTSIRRTQSGNLHVNQGLNLDEFLSISHPREIVSEHLLSISKAVTTLPQLKLSNINSIDRLRHGIALTPTEVHEGAWLSLPPQSEATVLVVGEGLEAIALATLKPDLSLSVRRVI